MKGQQLFYSFLPGVTAAVLTTQPAWAGTVKVSRVQVSSPSVLTSIYSQTLVADIMSTQLPNSAGISFPALVPTSSWTKLSVKPLSNHSLPAIIAGGTGMTIEQVPTKYEGRFLSLTPTFNSSQKPDVNRSVPSDQQQNNSGSFGQKLENIVAFNTTNTTSKAPSVPERILPMSSSQQPAVQKKNADTNLQTFLQTSAVGAGTAKLLVAQNCQQESRKTKTSPSAALLLTSSTCSQQNAPGERVAQSNIPAAPGTVTPASPTVPTPARPTPVTPVSPSSLPTQTAPTVVAPSTPGAVQIPENLNPSPNPLQYPTKPEEVTLQGNQPITLAQALELARRNNRDLQVSILQLQRSRAAVREQQAALFPNLSVSANIARSQDASNQLRVEQQERQTGISSPNGDPANTNFSGQAELRYDLYTSGRRQAAIRQAEEQERADELAVETQDETIRLNVATDYYNLQQADEQVRIAQSAVTNAQASLRDAEALERAGVGTRFDVLRSQVNLANSQQDLTNAISQQQTARRQLATRINLTQSVNISAADPVQLAGLWNQTLEQSIILAFQNRPELQQQLAQRNISEQQRRQALAELGPQFSVVASYNLLDQFDDQVSVTDGYSVGVQASLNLFDGGAARARAAQARANIAIAETQFGEQRNQIRFQVEQAFSTQQANLNNVQTANTALEQAREALRLARLRFQAGVGTQTDVINSENDLTRAEGNRVQAILDYNRALAQLQRAVTSRALR
ncbi:TolC family protein [Nostoc sp. UHCC 0302]|uniref:TolC family protein n=1 Tax=Nostoc sp. UHCC 0302 TaxID=3134896 RepID=UPI00311CDABC